MTLCSDLPCCLKVLKWLPSATTLCCFICDLQLYRLYSCRHRSTTAVEVLFISVYSNDERASDFSNQRNLHDELSGTNFISDAESERESESSIGCGLNHEQINISDPSNYEHDNEYLEDFSDS